MSILAKIFWISSIIFALEVLAIQHSGITNEDIQRGTVKSRFFVFVIIPAIISFILCLGSGIIWVAVQ